jgi:dihydroxyacetone kinase-like protein
VSRLAAAISESANAINAAADELNRLDAQAGDGDLGVTMATASKAALAVLAASGEATTADLLRACGTAIAQKAPSTSGTLVATGFLRAARALAGPDAPHGAPAFAVALAAARDGISERGKAETGSKTMLDSLSPAAEAAEQSAARGETIEGVVAAAATAADVGARATSTMRARHGRAGWLADRSEGHEDAGARMVAIGLSAAAASLAVNQGSK